MKDVLYVTGEFRRVVVNVNLLRSSHPDKTRDGSYRLLLHTFKHSSKDSHRPFLGKVFEQVLQTCEISAGCEVRMQLRRLRIQSIFQDFQTLNRGWDWLPRANDIVPLHIRMPQRVDEYVCNLAGKCGRVLTQLMTTAHTKNTRDFLSDKHDRCWGAMKNTWGFT